MRSINLTLDKHGDAEFVWRLNTKSRQQTATSQPFELTDEIHFLVRSFLSDPRTENHHRVAQMLGKTLGQGELLNQLIELSALTDSTFLYLAIPEALHHFPWECMQPDRCLDTLAHMMPTARVVPHEATQGIFLNQCLLISPQFGGHVRDRTLYASTRRLARRDQLEVLELTPPSSSTLKRAGRSGNLCVHFEGVQGDLVTLDDGQFRLNHLDLGGSTWLVTLGGTDSTIAGSLALSESDVTLCIARSFEVQPRTQAIFERAFYHALADGDSVGVAVYRARHTLNQTHLASRFESSAYVLSVREGHTSADQSEFPPPQVRRSLPLDLSGSVQMERLRNPLQNLHESPAHPVPLPVFIQESIQVLRGNLETQEQRDARKAALRRLAIRHTNQSDLSSLPREPSALRVFFESLVGIDDTDLSAPFGRNTELEELASVVGVEAEFAAGFVHALRAHQLICLEASDPTQARRFLRGISESIYGYCPRFFSHGGETAFFSGPCVRADGSYFPGGALARTLSSHWRRSESPSLQPEMPRPGTRLPSLGRVGDGWHIFKGSWLIIECTPEWQLQHLKRLMHILEARVFDGINENGRPFRVNVPKDFRVMLVCSETQAVPSTILNLNLDAAHNIQHAEEQWHQYLSVRFGAASGITEVQYRAQFVKAFHALLVHLQLHRPTSLPQGERLLGTAFAVGGEIQEALRTATEITFGISIARAVMDDINTKTASGLLTRLLDDNPAPGPRHISTALDLVVLRHGSEVIKSMSKGGTNRETVSALIRICNVQSRSGQMPAEKLQRE